MEEMKIGFVGLGLMGSGMTGNLLNAGYRLWVYDIDREKAEAVAAKGAQRIMVPADMAREVDVIILSLPNSHVVDEVVINDLKLLDADSQGLILIDTTTADPTMSEALANRLREKGTEMLDATISGTSRMCTERDITFMVGGIEEVFRKCEAILSAMAERTYYLGKNGAGALMKLIVNLVLGLNRMVLAEGLSLGKKAGMDLHRLLEVLRNSAAYSRAMDMKGDKMVEEDFLPPEGKLAFHLKDVHLMLQLGRRLDVPLVLSSMHAQALTTQVAKGRGEWDNAAIISFYKDIAGT